MPATESAVCGEAPAGALHAAAGSELDIVLKPLNGPEVGEIRVAGVLAVGRSEQPFATCRDDILVMLSRRAGVPSRWGRRRSKADPAATRESLWGSPQTVT